MEWHDPSNLAAPLVPPGPQPAPAVEPIAPERGGLGLKRAVLTASLSALLLVGGAAAVVSAASPSPSASSAPGTTTTPSTRPQHGTGGSTVNCPNMGTDGSSGSGSSGSSGSSSPAATPAN